MWGAQVEQRRSGRSELRPYKREETLEGRGVAIRIDLGCVGSKPRDLGGDRGYRVVVVEGGGGLNLNPHPFKNGKGAAPDCRQGVVILRTWGAACCAPIDWW